MPDPTKGITEEGNTWIIWDAVRNCRVKKCPIYKVCAYAKGKNKKCKAEIKYISSVFKSIDNSVGDKMTQLLLNKISLHLIPLYHQLVILKIEAYAVDSVIYYNKQGAMKINPIFKEIRETISSIEKTQRSMGIDGEYLDIKNHRGRLKPVGKSFSDAPPQDANPDYYDTLFEEDKKAIAKDINPGHGVKYTRKCDDDPEEPETEEPKEESEG